MFWSPQESEVGALGFEKGSDPAPATAAAAIGVIPIASAAAVVQLARAETPGTGGNTRNLEARGGGML